MEESSTTSGCLIPILGAVVANLVSYAVAFAFGAIFGAAFPALGFFVPESPTSYGLGGGLAGMARLFVVSVEYGGFIPAAVGIAGGFIADNTSWFARPHDRGNVQPKAGTCPTQAAPIATEVQTAPLPERAIGELDRREQQGRNESTRQP